MLHNHGWVPPLLHGRPPIWILSVESALYFPPLLMPLVPFWNAAGIGHELLNTLQIGCVWGKSDDEMIA